MPKNTFLNRPNGFLNISKSLFKIDHKTSIIIRICEIIIIIIITTIITISQSVGPNKLFL